MADSNNSLPHRFSEKSFRRYESTIAQAVNGYPYAIIINPIHFKLASETVRGRLRDALTSYDTHRWSTILFTPEAFDKAHPHIIVRLLPDGKVHFGPEATIMFDSPHKEFVPMDSEILDLTNVSSFSCEDLLCYLAHSGALKKQIKLNINQQTADILLTKYDIALTPLSDNSFLLQ